MKKCSFTGHRQIKREHMKNIHDLVTRAINFAYSEGCRDFLSGGALGFDTVCARAVIGFRLTHPDVRLVMVLPCVNQDSKWSAEQKDAYSYILSNADETVYVSEEYTPSCMRKRNQLLADEADILISYVCRSDSGAAQTERMAKQLGKRVYNLYPALEKDTV